MRVLYPHLNSGLVFKQLPIGSPRRAGQSAPISAPPLPPRRPRRAWLEFSLGKRRENVFDLTDDPRNQSNTTRGHNVLPEAADP